MNPAAASLWQVYTFPDGIQIQPPLWQVYTFAERWQKGNLANLLNIRKLPSLIPLNTSDYQHITKQLFYTSQPLDSQFITIFFRESIVYRANYYTLAYT